MDAPPTSPNPMPEPALSARVPSLAPPALGRKARYLLLSLVVVVLDQWSKWLVELHLPEHVAEPVLPFLNFTHVRNTGVAFGLFAGNGEAARAWVLTGLGLTALTLVGIYFWRALPANRLLLGALALVLGGAVGNLADRVLSGGVTDFIDFYVGTYHWHTFNVADSAITVGIVLMALDALRPHRRESDEPAA